MCDVGAGVAVEVVPEDEQAVAEQSEGDGALDGFLDPVAGLPDAEDGSCSAGAGVICGSGVAWVGVSA